MYVKYIIVLSLTLALTCYSREVKYELQQVSISGIALGSKSDKLVKRFGKPDRLEHVEPEMDVRPYDEYYYGKSFFEITSKILTGFEINDARFQLDQGKIKVGDSFERLQEAFPNQLIFDRNQAKIKLRSSDDYLLFVIDNGKVYSFSLYKEQ